MCFLSLKMVVSSLLLHQPLNCMYKLVSSLFQGRMQAITMLDVLQDNDYNRHQKQRPTPLYDCPFLCLLSFTLHSCPHTLSLLFLLCLHCFHGIVSTKAGTVLGNVCWQTLPAPPADTYLFIEKNKTTALWPAGPGRFGCMNPFLTGESFHLKLLLN